MTCLLVASRRHLCGDYCDTFYHHDYYYYDSTDRQQQHHQRRRRRHHETPVARYFTTHCCTYIQTRTLPSPPSTPGQNKQTEGRTDGHAHLEAARDEKIHALRVPVRVPTREAGEHAAEAGLVRRAGEA